MTKHEAVFQSDNVWKSIATMATVVSALRQGILLIPMLFVMNRFFGVTGNIWARIVSDIGSAIIAICLAVQQYRKFQANILK